jgi:hypothetical protein
MSIPTPDQQARLLIRRGIMPSEADRIVAEAESGRLIDPLAEPLELQQQRAEAWWMYQESVPFRFKRLLGAVEYAPADS